MSAPPVPNGPNGARITRRAPLSQWTTLGVGGPADQLVEVEDVGALSLALMTARREGSPVLVLGGGSNIVVSDDGFAGAVVHIGIKGRQVNADADDVLISIGAGEDWALFVRFCIAEGFSGVECLAGIPGSVGGTPVQNVGAYGQEVRGTIEAVGVWDRLHERSGRLAAAECSFAYRDSIFKRSERYVVTDVLFRLQRSRWSQPLRYAELADRLGCRLGQRAPLSESADTVVALRRVKGMVLDSSDPDSRSAGSFFTNPVLDEAQMARLRSLAPDVPSFTVPEGTKVPAGWLVERAGFARGHRNGTAAISTKHALALTAGVDGTAADVVALAREVREGVRARFGVLLEPEPVLIGLHL